MTKARSIKPVAAAGAAISLCVTMAMWPSSPTVSSAYADTYTDLVNAQNQKKASQQREAQLRAQLQGVSADLADKIVELDDLTNTQIPAAQSAVDAANEAAANAQAEADSAANRLEAAQQDKKNLEAQIEQTGKDYDDARAAVAQMAREDMQGSDAADVMSIVTGATDTTDYINAMQSQDALSRTESNAASDAATSLNTSMNRSERLAAIEKQIAALKADADAKAASAQQAATDAQTERDALDKLRVEGEQKRAELEDLQNQLDSDTAKQAAQTVLLQSQVDDLNRQWAQEQADAAGDINSGNQGSTQPSGGNSGSSGGSNSSGGSSSSAGTGTGGQGTSNGDYGNMYVAGQCTWYAYNRRAQMGIGTPSYLGNGGEWYINAPRYGLRVDHNPQVGAALSFIPGQDGADGFYGHVAVVEAVYSDGTFLISEMNWSGPYTMHSRVLTNYGQYWFVH